MNQTKEQRLKQNSLKIFNLMALIVNLEERVPDEVKLKESKVRGSEVLEKGTEGFQKDKLGVELTHSELLPFLTYFRECMNNKEVENIVIGVYAHSNDKLMNTDEGTCDYKFADYAEVSVITSEKTIKMYLNYKNPINNKVGNYVEVKNTSWKKLPELGMRSERRKSLINRVIITAAILCERYENREFSSRNEFMNYFTHVDAVSPEEVIKRIRNEGNVNHYGNTCVLDITYDEMQIRILKMVYNKLRNESLRIRNSEAFNDRTYIEFEVKNHTLAFNIRPVLIVAELGYL